MRRHRIVGLWLGVVALVVVLYTIVPVLFFNDGHARIAGMPALLFWFTVLPFVIPAVLGALYVHDRRAQRRTGAGGDEGRAR